MNSYTLQKIGLYLFGAVTGGFIGYKVAAHFIHEDVVESEPIKEAEESGNEITVEGVTVNTEIEELVIEKDEKGEAKVTKKRKARETRANGNVVVDYTKCHTPNPHVQKARLSELAAKYKSAAEEPEEEPAKDKNAPFIISLEEYSEPNGRERQTLTYYEVDDVLADPSENIIEDGEIRNVIGEEALVKFGTRSDDPDVVYVRNNRLGIDYEVVRHRGSYAVEVAGLDEDEEPTRKRKNRRKPEDEESE